MTRAALVVLACLALAIPADAYLKLGSEVGRSVVGLRWPSMPVRYFVTNRDVPGVTAPDLQRAVARAFDTWGRVPGAGVRGEFAGFTDAEPFQDENMSVIGFRARPDLDTTLGATTFTVDAVTGAILESDILLNTTFAWSTADAGLGGRYDVESIVLHELGHLLGLGHSALGETAIASNGRRRLLAKGAVMFPIAFPAGSIEDRALQPDDVAGVTDVYRPSSADRTRGTVRGRVRLAGQGVFGAHVTAFNVDSGDLVGTFSLGLDGAFVLASLAPGLYVVRVEPLDDADLDSFFDAEAPVDIAFRPAYATGLVGVPAGGGTDVGDIAVVAK